MNLFINSISKNGIIIIFDNSRIIKDKINLNIKGNESSKLIPKIDELLEKNNIKYEDLENIVVVNGPGSFTGIRTTVLVVNTINYIIKKGLTPVSYFDLFQKYPIIKSSSRRDSFFKESENDEIKIIKNEDLLDYLKIKNILRIYGENSSEVFDEIKIFEKIDYENIISTIKFGGVKIIKPLYIKKPNIS